MGTNIFLDLAGGIALLLWGMHMVQTGVMRAFGADLRTFLQSALRNRARAFVVGAGATAVLQSSTATGLMVAAFSASGMIALVPALALLGGANRGRGITPGVGGGALADPASRRVPVGNLLNRVVGCALVLPFLPQIAALIAWLDPMPARQAADFHTLFNLVMAALFIAPLKPFARLLERLLPQQAKSADPGAPLYLDPGAVQTPSVALTCAAREVLHMGDMVDTMLRQSMTAMMTDDRKLVAQIERADNAVDKLHEAVKLYVTQITRESLDEDGSRRAMEIIAFDINLEHIGDIIDKNLMELAGKKIKNKLKFSE